MTTPINNSNQQSFPLTVKIIKSIGWIVLAILALPSSLAGYERSRLFLKKVVVIWSEKKNPTTEKVASIVKQKNVPEVNFKTDLNHSSTSGIRTKDDSKASGQKEIENSYMQPKTGKKLGIEGRNNGCVPSSILMGLFAATTLTDFLLEFPSNATPEQKEFKELLKNTLVQPLREKGIVSEEAFSQIRALVSNDVGCTITMETFMEKFLQKIGRENYVYESYGLYEKSLAEIFGTKLSHSSVFQETIKLKDLIDDPFKENKVKKDPTLITLNFLSPDENLDKNNHDRDLPPRIIFLEDGFGNKIQMSLLSIQLLGRSHCKTILFNKSEAYYYDSQSFMEYDINPEGIAHPAVFKMDKLLEEFPRDFSFKKAKLETMEEGNKKMKEICLTAIKKNHQDVYDILPSNMFDNMYEILTTREIACNYIKVMEG